MFDRFTDDAKRALAQTRQEALRLHHRDIDVGHLLLSLLRTEPPLLVATLPRLGIDTTRLLAAIDLAMEPGLGAANEHGALPFTTAAKDALLHASAVAAELGIGQIGCEHLLLGAIHAAHGPVRAALDRGGVRYEDVHRAFDDRDPQQDEPWLATAAAQPRGPRHNAIEAMRAQLRRLTDDAVATEAYEAAAALRDLYAACVQARRVTASAADRGMMRDGGRHVRSIH